MGDATKIQWTDTTWNPVRGCSRVSKGCEHCYAEATARRFAGPGGPYEGLLRLDREGRPKAQWNGKVSQVEEHFDDPLRWERPRRVFVNSMSDLFHETLSMGFIGAIFGIMASAPRHEFQVLTKRSARLVLFQEWIRRKADEERTTVGTVLKELARALVPDRNLLIQSDLSHILVGVSVEDQAAYDERAPHLALWDLLGSRRFLSYEPALGPVTFGFSWQPTLPHWVIVGGESGPRARPFDIAWARSTVEQCQRAGVPVFVKQLGDAPTVTRPSGAVIPYQPSLDLTGGFLRACSRKGGEPAEWPEDIRVREWPKGGGR